MDFLDPVLGTLTGIEPAQWRSILVFSLKVFLFCLPFVILGFLVEKDVYRVSAVNRTTKTLLLLICVSPVFLLAVFNYLAPKLPGSFWERHTVLESFWIMEGSLAPLILAGLCLIYVLLYLTEIVRGDLRD